MKIIFRFFQLITILILISFLSNCTKKESTSLPSVITVKVDSISQTIVKYDGSVLNDGGSIITAKGVCWSTKSKPTIKDSCTIDGKGLGDFKSYLNNLTQNTTYFICAYATNSNGTAYSDPYEFTTKLDDNIYPIVFNPSINYGSVTDADGNTYKTVIIGTQTWMAENLRTTKYNDGTDIPVYPQYGTLTSPAYCWFNDTIPFKNTYGYLYNWYAVNTGKLAPIGWRVPSDSDWMVLNNYYGGDSISGYKLKEAGNLHWRSPNVGSDNSSGFTALPGGDVMGNGIGILDFQYGYWWTSTQYKNGYDAWAYCMSSCFSKNERGYMGWRLGLSVRCIKN
jgi:uncharacterized protein (TIGR02145 family)